MEFGMRRITLERPASEKKEQWALNERLEKSAHIDIIHILYYTLATIASIRIYKNAIRRRKKEEEERDGEDDGGSRRKFENNPRWPRRWTTNKRSNTWYSKVDSLVFLAEVSLKAFQCVSFSVYFLVFILFIAILCSGCCHTDSLSVLFSLLFFFSSHLLTYRQYHGDSETSSEKKKTKNQNIGRQSKRQWWQYHRQQQGGSWIVHTQHFANDKIQQQQQSR